jgi:hypothetical protein
VSASPTLSLIICALWFVLAAVMVYYAFRTHRFLFVPAFFFLFLGGWTLADFLSPVDLMAGVWVWIYRAVAVLILGVCLFRYYLYKKNGR